MFKEKKLNNNVYYYIIIKTMLHMYNIHMYNIHMYNIHMYNIQNVSYRWSNSNTTYLGKVGSNSSF